jgi:hypothetical protein
MAAKVVVGTTFYSYFADGNPLWEVVKARGGNAWDCVIKSDDYSGTKKVFGTEEILRALETAKMWDNIASEHDTWWNSQEVGATVHYHNGFGQYVRGVIVEENGEKKMRCTALVGNWQDYDLPRIDAAGNLHLSHYVRRIVEGDGETMQPNYSNMVEAVGVREGKGEDPRGKPAIDLTLPQASGEQAEAARLMAIREQVMSLLQVEQDERPFSETLRAALVMARNLLKQSKL